MIDYSWILYWLVVFNQIRNFYVHCIDALSIFVVNIGIYSRGSCVFLKHRLVSFE